MERKGMGSAASEVMAGVLAKECTKEVIIMDPKREQVLKKPYTAHEMRKVIDRDGYLSGNIVIELDEVISCDQEQFLDLCAIRLVDNECLMDISYKAVGICSDGIIINVRGDVSEILEDLEDVVKEIKDAAVRIGAGAAEDILGCCYDESTDMGIMLEEALSRMSEESLRKFYNTYCSEEMKKGYAVTDFDGTGMLEIQRVDAAHLFATDEEAVEQAVKDGVKIIPVGELPGNFERRYLGWVDTPENRKAIENYCKLKQ